ncbi:MAG: lysylphosphatidylglycerol synthase transmembrane domain-containing protein [Phormidesmis sp.]
MKKKALHFLRIAVTTALLVYVFHQAGLLSAQGWQDLAGTFSRANLWLILISILLVPIIDIVSSIKWYCLAQAVGLPVGLWRLYAYYLIGGFFNLVLPSSIGGDFIRIHELSRYTGRYAESAAVVFVERFSGLAMLVFLAAIAVVVNLQMFNLPWLTVTLTIGLLGVALICWVIIDARPFNFIDKNLGSRLPLIASFLKKLGKFRTAVLVYKDKPGALWVAVFNSLVFYFLAVVNVWVSASAFDSSISFVSMLVAVPVIMFIMNLPISIGGIGLMESAYSFTLSLFGINPAVAISTALFMRLKTLITAGMGSLAYPMVSDGMGSPQQLAQSVQRLGKDDTHA